MHGMAPLGSCSDAETAHSAHEHERCCSWQVADFGLSREVVKSRIDTDSFGTITHTPPELLRDGCARLHPAGSEDGSLVDHSAAHALACPHIRCFHEVQV